MSSLELLVCSGFDVLGEVATAGVTSTSLISDSSVTSGFKVRCKYEIAFI